MQINWHDLMVSGVPWAEKVLRSLVVYIALVAALRLVGKRLLAQLNPFDFVVLLILSNTVQNAIIGNDNSLAGGLVGAAALLGVNYMMVALTYRSPTIERLVEGSPDVLIEHGTVRDEALARERISHLELAAAARKQGFESLDEIDHAVLDPGGAIFFKRRDEAAFGHAQQQVLDRLERIERRLQALSADRGDPGSAPAPPPA